MDEPNEVVKSKETDLIYQENVKEIITAAAHVENRLAAGVGKYFFGDDIERHQKFDNLVLSSDFFSFSAKRKSFLQIIREQKVLTGSKVNDFEQLISKVIKYRNMFTHGTPVYSGSKCILHFFEGSKREIEITEEFLEKVESQITECLFTAEHLVQIIKITNT